MPRPLRIHISGGFYHVTLRGNHQQEIFCIDSDRTLLNTIVAAALPRYQAEIHAYCWMTNHLHFLVKVNDVPLGALVRHIAAGYARAYQKNLQTTGHLFERRYHSRIVDTEAYLLELVRYIHLNPVSAGLVREADQYRWSSHHAYTGSRVESWVNPRLALGLFSPDPARRVALYRGFLERGPRTTQIPVRDLHAAIPPGDTLSLAINRSRVVSAQSCALDMLAADACRRFDVPMETLRTRVRDPKVALARAWVAKQARERRLANLSEVARFFGCDQGALRHAVERFRLQLAEAV